VFKGEILVCEDNAINQQVIVEQLERVGIDVTLAVNGKEGVDMVKSRINGGGKPFDLIFMDIHMPVMDGLEAAAIITGLQTGTPIVAMTANIMSSDKTLYETSGLPDCVSKPFTSQELWCCLMKYLTPVGRGSVNHSRQMEKDDAEEIDRQLKTIFVKSNQTKFEEIVKAIADGDIILAHRIAHNLKGNAGLIGKIGLINAAANVERLLLNGKNMATEEDMGLLEREVNAVLQELAPLLDEGGAPVKTLSHEQANDLLIKLELMLNERNPECRYLLDDLRAVPGAGLLVEQVDDLDFKQAMATLAQIKKEMEVT